MAPPNDFDPPTGQDPAPASPADTGGVPGQAPPTVAWSPGAVPPDLNAPQLQPPAAAPWSIPQPGPGAPGGPPPGYQQAPYGQPGYPQPAAQAPPGLQPPYGPPGAQGPPAASYGQPPFQQPYPSYQAPGYGYSATLPNHSSATTSLVLGIIGLIGFFFCVVPILLSPVAWFVGNQALREIDANPGRWGGRDYARAGQILGIIGTVLLTLGIVGFGFLVVIAAASS